MAVATRTKLQCIEGAARRLGCLIEGTLTGATTTVLTIASGNSSRYFRTSRAYASDQALNGAEVYLKQATPPTPNPNIISLPDVGDGTLTVGVTYSAGPTATGTFDVFTHDVRYTDLEEALNETLRGLYYEARVPLTFVVDGDMESSVTTDWTASNATHSKVTGVDTLWSGARASRVLATAATGYIQSTSIPVDPTNAASWRVRANVRADVGTARLIAWDASNGAQIDSEDWALRGWGTLDFQFALPATCEVLAFRLMGVANADDTFWDNLIAWPVGCTEIPLPDWLLDRLDVREVYSTTGDEDRAMFGRPTPERFTVLPDMANPNRQWKLYLPGGFYQPTYFKATRNYPTVSVDADTTFCPQDLVELGTAMRTASIMLERMGPGGAGKWGAVYKKFNRRYYVKRHGYGPQVISRNTS